MRDTVCTIKYSHNNMHFLFKVVLNALNRRAAMNKNHIANSFILWLVPCNHWHIGLFSVLSLQSTSWMHVTAIESETKCLKDLDSQSHWNQKCIWNWAHNICSMLCKCERKYVQCTRSRSQPTVCCCCSCCTILDCWARIVNLMVKLQYEYPK